MKEKILKEIKLRKENIRYYCLKVEALRKKLNSYFDEEKEKINFIISIIKDYNEIIDENKTKIQKLESEING